MLLSFQSKRDDTGTISTALLTKDMRQDKRWLRTVELAEVEHEFLSDVQVRFRLRDFNKNRGCNTA